MSARTHRPTVRFTEAEYEKVQARAELHGVPVATYIAGAALNGPLDPKKVAKDADQWWDNLPAGRRQQIHHWVSQRTPTGGLDPDVHQPIDGFPSV